MCCISFRSAHKIKTGKWAVTVENGRTGHGGNEKESRTKAKWRNNVSSFVSWYVFIFYVYFILLLIITSRLIETMTRKFQPPPPLSTTTTTMTTYRLVWVTIGCSGNGEETRIKGSRYICFFSQSRHVCLYIHVTCVIIVLLILPLLPALSSSYLAFLSEYFSSFIIILLLMFYYQPLSTAPTHPFTHSPMHPSMMIPRWSHIVDHSHWPNYIINHPRLCPGHQHVHTAHHRPLLPIQQHYRQFPNIASITNAQEYPFQHISQPQRASSPLASGCRNWSQLVTHSVTGS